MAGEIEIGENIPEDDYELDPETGKIVGEEELLPEEEERTRASVLAHLAQLEAMVAKIDDPEKRNEGERRILELKRRHRLE